ncbi:conserved hypothetical protein [Ricinus communis]|uniref:Uncharacterized protein n=1 Tax=Ricinus communis TaxID=3988 RepID=B9SQG0_RICCO|nr:conserved hypothetical protein [Ricinus communis]
METASPRAPITITCRQTGGYGMHVADTTDFTPNKKQIEGPPHPTETSPQSPSLYKNLSQILGFQANPFLDKKQSKKAFTIWQPRKFKRGRGKQKK